MSPAHVDQPLLIDLDEDRRNEQLDEVERWLGNVVISQSMYRRILEDAVDDVQTTAIRKRLEMLLEEAKNHEEVAEDLYEAIDRDAESARAMPGLLSTASEAMADLEEALGGAAGPWGDLEQAFLANFKATGAFATAMSLGIALGIDEMAHVVMPVIREKFTHERYLQQILLETAGVAILDDRSI